MSLAEIVAAALTAFLASAAVVPYLMDAAGVGLMPGAVLAASATIAGAVAWRLAASPGSVASDLVPWAGVVLLMLAWLLRLAWPSLLLPGGGSDLAHHLLLVDYIERSGHLVHDRALDGAMGEMAHYTPGAHLLAVMAGAWTGTDGFRAFYSVVSGAMALAAGFVFLIVRRLRLPTPFALAAVMLLMLPLDYFVGAFTHDAFLAQAVCVCFSVAAWWALVAWERHPTPEIAAVFGLFTAAVFLAWPVWVGPPLLVFFGVLLRRHVSIGWRVRHLMLGVAPLAAVAVIHTSGRLGWAAIVRTSGAVLQPTLSTIGWAFPLLAAIGLLAVTRNRRARVTVAFLLASALQAFTLGLMSMANGAETPYMAYKMGYLAIYPMAALGALALHGIVVRAAAPVQTVAGWVMATFMVLAIVRPAINVPRQISTVTRDLYDAGRSMRESVGPACADYLVGSADTAYWLHLAVLGNPRSSAHTAEIDRFDPRQVMGQWVASQGRGYAVADLDLLPAEIRPNVQILKQFGRAAIVHRPGATCP